MFREWDTIIDWLEISQWLTKYKKGAKTMAKRTNEDELNRHPQAEDVEEVVEENATAEYAESTTEENSVVETTWPEDE